MDYVIYMFDLFGYVISWNVGVRCFKGYEFDEIIGKYFFCFYMEVDCESGIFELVLEIVECEGCFEIEGWWVCKDGMWFWVSVVIDLIWDDGGKLFGFVKVMCDFIDWKKVDE